MLPRLPNRRAPGVDRMITLRTWWRREDVTDCDIPVFARQIEPRPSSVSFRKQHVRELHLASGVPLLEVQIKSEESEGDGNGLCFGRCMLGGEGIDGVLMNERSITMSEGVET